jgi:PII-like signaling protein
MLQAGKAKKVSIYLSEGESSRGAANSATILDFLFFHGISGATVLKGVAGFGADHRIHSASAVEISAHLPIKIEFVESVEKVDELLGKLEKMAGSGMIEIQETTVVKPPRAGKTRKSEPAPEHLRIDGKAKMMQIYIGESDRFLDQPLYEALVKAMRAHDLAGVTVYRAILGYGAHRRVHKETPLRLSRDSSITLSVIDTEEKLRAFLPIAEQMIVEGLLVISDVDVMKYAYRPTHEGDESEESKGSTP